MSGQGICRDFASHKRGSILLLTLGLMVVLSGITTAYMSLVTHHIRNLGGQINNVQAFYLADAGLNKAIWYLLNTAPDSSTNGSWRTTAYPAAFGAGVTDPQQESLGNDGTYVIWVENDSGDSGGDSIQAFSYAIHSGDKIEFKDMTNSTINGNISANKDIKDINDITLNGTATANSTVTLPVVDTDAYAGIAANVVNGDKTFLSNTVYTGIWYVDGEVTIESGVTINGSIIATDKIEIKKKANSVTITPESPNPALVSLDEIKMEELSNSTINGLIFASNKIKAKKGNNNTFNGVLISGDKMELKDSTNITLNYDQNISSNPPPYFTEGTEASGTIIKIISQGSVEGITRTVQQKINFTSGTLGAFNFATHSGKDIDFKGVNNGTINGDVSAAKNLKNLNDVTINGTTTENSGVASPVVDTNAYAAIADQVVNGDKIFLKNTTYTGVWYIDGEVTIEDNVTFTGSIIATDKIDMKKTKNFSITPAVPNPAMVSLKDIKMEEIKDSTINGLVYSGKKIKLKKSKDNIFNGSLIADDKIEFKDAQNFTVTYDAGLLSNPPPYFTGATGSGSTVVTSVAGSWKEI